MTRGLGSSLLRACALIGVWLLLAAGAPALAQNTAETPPPKQEDPAKEKPGANKAEKAPAAKAGKRKPGAKKNEPARNVTDNAAAKAGGKKSSTKGESGPGAQQADPVGAGTAAAADQPAGPPADGQQSPAQADKVILAADGTTTGDLSGELGSAGQSIAPAISEPGDLFKQFQAPNTAEGRTAGGEAGNRAESLTTDGKGIAQPPEPPFTLPSPEGTAGPVQGYTAPEISLNLPPLEEPPGVPSVDKYNKPEREYLKDRPLPPPDTTETDQEKMARNIEESLKRINLALETRPAEGIQIPLPSGVVTFKAAQSFQFDRRNRILTFTGNAEIIFSDIGVWADQIEINDSAATAYAKGSVAIRQRDEILYCDEAYINYDTLNLELYNVEGNSSGPRIQGRLYYTAQRATGTFDRLTLEKAEVTTCDPFCGSPKEAHLSAHKAVYKRDTSIVLHDVYIYTREHKVGYIPLLAFPLPRNRRYEQEQSKIQQNYGYSRTEGFFAKFAYTYASRWVDNVDKPLVGVVKLDVSQRLGPLLGLRQDFYIPSLGVTTIKAEYGEDWPQDIAHNLLGRKQSTEATNYLVDFRQELNLSRYLTGSLTSTRTNKYNPGSTLYATSSRTNTWDSGLDLNYTKNDTHATLSGSQTINTTGGISNPDQTNIQPEEQTVNSSAAFTFDRALSKSLTFRYNEGYTANKGGLGRRNLPADQEGRRSLGLTWNGKWKGSFNPKPMPETPAGTPGGTPAGTPAGTPGAPAGAPGSRNQPQTPRKSEPFTVDLKYQKSAIDYDKDKNTADNSVQLNDIKPGVEITFPRNLINDGAYFTNFKLSFQNLVTGRRRKPIKTFRTFAQMSGGDRIEFSKSSFATTSLDIRQYFYSGSASNPKEYNSQYVIAPRVTYNYDPRSGFRFDTTWSMNYRQGVREPPVSGDRQIYNQTLSYGVSYTNYRSWQYALRGSYNIAHDTLQPFSSTFSWDPNRTFGLSQTFTLNYLVGVIPGDTSGQKHKRFKVDSPAINGVLRSPYIDDNGFYNWQLRFSLSNVPGDAWQTQRFRLTYFKKFQRGWSTEILGSYERRNTLFKLDASGNATTEPVDFGTDFRRRVLTPNFIKKIAVRKTNCCTTIEGGWRSELHEFYISMYLNALPQYPGFLGNQRETTTSGGATSYGYATDFAFPTQTVFGDIMTEVFGTNPLQNIGSFY